ncbi:unnamed protein product [Bursaphelenchus xylophilus]|uniref:(pine wood nematode) hypothetical protein n=1 Tax=Bursaphelenchus xylophilus TaxID=6326 RepID=A0A1I7SCH4_BURXY|nr:unnamed protein product [Bursaphelenchus xylophilus]CAG9094091.1 unnamed protein product [Bursaphelenchus xylophilus]
MLFAVGILVILIECAIFLRCASKKTKNPTRNKGIVAAQRSRPGNFSSDNSHREYPEAARIRGADSRTSAADMSKLFDPDPQKASKSHDTTETSRENSAEAAEAPKIRESDRAMERLKEKQSGVPAKLIQQDEQELSKRLKPKDYDQRAKPLGKCMSMMGKCQSLPGKCMHLLGVVKAEEERKIVTPKIGCETPETKTNSMQRQSKSSTSDADKKLKSITPPKNNDG